MYIEQFEERRIHSHNNSTLPERRTSSCSAPSHPSWEKREVSTASDQDSNRNSEPNGLYALGTKLLSHHAKELLEQLRYTTVLPNYVVERWSRKIHGISLDEPAHSLAILDEIYVDYWSVFGAYKPGHELFDFDEVQPLHFSDEMQGIKNELEALETILARTEQGSRPFSGTSSVAC